MNTDEEDLDMPHKSPQVSTSACGGSKHADEFEFVKIFCPYLVTSAELNDVPDLKLIVKRFC